MFADKKLTINCSSVIHDLIIVWTYIYGEIQTYHKVKEEYVKTEKNMWLV